MPLVDNFVTFGSQVDPQSASYYANLTGFWRGDVTFYNLTHLETNATSPLPPWHSLADNLVTNANLTNATEFAHLLGNWNWSRSDKVAISFGDKLLRSENNSRELSKDVAMIHVSLMYMKPIHHD